jgi:uncharacterized protein YndB with AHSA1/START domain
MPTNPAEQTISTLEVVKDEEIAASIDIVFEALLEQIGPYNETPDGSPMVMHLEAWPGGRWFRDLGNSTGHFWGHVQAIKPPTLLEICGPLFMSFPAMSNVQYRLSEVEGGLTRVRFAHRAIGQIPDNFREGPSSVNTGWSYLFTKIRENAERKSDALRGSR